MSISGSGKTTNRVPEPVARVSELMSAFGAPWSLCGGWAVDAWLGRQTRDHSDVDISVFAEDQLLLFDHLSGWHLVAHDDRVADDTTEAWNGRRLKHPAHIHAGPDPDTVAAWVSNAAARPEDFKLEIVLDERAGNEWILDRHPRIALHLRGRIRRSIWGLPTAGPEILCFYKATAYFGVEGMEERPQDEVDFLALLPLLSKMQASWLRQALALARPGHPWLAHLLR